MKKMSHLLFTISLLLTLVSSAPEAYALDQNPPPGEPSGLLDAQTMMAGDSHKEKSVTGMLKSVDPEAKKLVVTADGADIEFVFNDQTRCTGTQDTVQGLSTSAGSTVTVSYKEENQQRIATLVEVKAS